MSDSRICPSCQSANEESALFCAACEAVLPPLPQEESPPSFVAPPSPDALAQCPQCGTRNPAAQAYCWRCLHELGPEDALEDSAPPPKDEEPVPVAEPLVWPSKDLEDEPYELPPATLPPPEIEPEPGVEPPARAAPAVAPVPATPPQPVSA